MTTASDRELNYDELLDVLLRKTVEGKIDWRPTADESRFIAAVKGRQTFEIRRVERPYSLVPGAPAPNVTVFVTVRNEHEGEVIMDFRVEGFETLAYDLFEAARRKALRLDDRLNEAVELLNSL
jgi:hypothetical protein